MVAVGTSGVTRISDCFVPIRVRSGEDLQTRQVADAVRRSEPYVLLHVLYFKGERLLACEETRG